MNGSEPCARKHGNDGFRHHGHVDDDAIAFADTKVSQDGGENCDLVAQRCIGIAALRFCNRAVVNERGIPAAVGGDVPVEAIVGGVALGSNEPASIRATFCVKDLIEWAEPVDGFGRACPECRRVFLPVPVNLVISAHSVSQIYVRRRAHSAIRSWASRGGTGSGQGSDLQGAS